jgi:Putative peptidoglycan binding domain
MSSVHVVQQGEHLSGISVRYGFADYRTIWDHPQNAQLKKQRNPNVLFPGDSFFIPDREIRTENRPTDQLHKFKRPDEPLKLTIVLNRVYGDPFANTPCSLVIDTTKTELTSDGSGKIENEISKAAVNGVVIVQDQIAAGGTSVPVSREIRIKIGHLDPVEELSGQKARLANLGYYRGPDEPTDDDEFLSAVEEFQHEHGVGVDGKCGPNTQAKLKTVHGC